MKIHMEECALAAREAHIALLDLRRVVEEAAQATQDAEFEAVHLAINRRADGDITTKVRKILDQLASSNFEGTEMKHEKENYERC